MNAMLCDLRLPGKSSQSAVIAGAAVFSGGIGMSPIWFASIDSRPFSLRMRAVGRSLVQEHPQEAQVVGRRRIERVAHAVELGLGRRRDVEVAELAVLAADLHRREPHLHVILDLEARVAHLQRIEDLLLAEAIDRAPIDLLDDAPQLWQRFLGGRCPSLADYVIRTRPTDRAGAPGGH
jgi:hypothetical protein